MPALNEEAAIRETIMAVQSVPEVVEVIVVDGGSRDATILRAKESGARVIEAPRGRGTQMHAGAEAARGDVLWFVHADTRVPSDAGQAIVATIASGRASAGHLRIRFDGGSRPARLLTATYGWFALLGLRYGDSAYFLERNVYESIGGFRGLPLFEDLDLLRRLRRAGLRFVRLDPVVVTSSRRFERRSFAKVFARWVGLQLLYWVGAPPTRLARWYEAIRK